MGSVLGENGQAASLEEFYHRVLSNVTARVGAYYRKMNGSGYTMRQDLMGSRPH